jgi:DNA-directed RNA polymerase subunit M/transcription elongation factor TFIIS
MLLPRAQGRIPTTQRINALRLLADYQSWETARNNEAIAHAVSNSRAMYIDKMQQIIYNVCSYTVLREHENLALQSNEELARGTIIEDIGRERTEQRVRFEQILAEKYEKVNRSSCKSAMRCRRCGNNDVMCDQKQTRGADEAMTVFCTCTKCNNRWTMR